MKTIKLKREYFGEDTFNNNPHLYEWQTQGGSNFMCAEVLHNIFRINKRAKSLWLTIRKTPTKGFYKATFEYGAFGRPCVLVDGKGYDLFFAAEQFLGTNGIENGQEFYFSIDYSLDK